MPGVRFILNPAALISRRTQPVLVKVLMVEPGAARRASSANSSAVHISGFFRRGEAVEKPRIDLCVQLWQLLQGIADQQGQGHATVIQHQALETLVNGDVLGQQLRGQGLQLGPEGEGTLQVGATQRVLFYADKVQVRTGYRVLFKQLPGA
jgi:hypothetical protein